MLTRYYSRRVLMLDNTTVLLEEKMARIKTFAVHPGEILKTEFMDPMGISVYRLAKDLRFAGMYDVVRGKRAISVDTALRLGKYFDLPAKFWLNLQNDYDLRIAQR